MPIRETETHIITSLFVSVVRNYVVRANLISRGATRLKPQNHKQNIYFESHMYVETICSQKNCSFYREGISLALSLPPGTFRITKQTKAPRFAKSESRNCCLNALRALFACAQGERMIKYLWLKYVSGSDLEAISAHRTPNCSLCWLNK
jgi:hypothetical protein